MGLLTFKINTTSTQQAEYILLLLRNRISDAVINLSSFASGHICPIKTNSDVTEISASLFTKEGFDYQKI